MCFNLPERMSDDESYKTERFDEDVYVNKFDSRKLFSSLSDLAGGFHLREAM